MLPNLLLEIGPLPVYTFGVVLAAAFILGIFLFWRTATKEGFASDPIFDLIFLSVLAALIGGRLFFIVFTGDPPLTNLPRLAGAILRVGEGIFWAPAELAGLTAFSLYIRRRKEWSFFKLADLAAPILALGQGIGFLGAEITSYLSSTVGLWPIGVGFLGLFLILEFAKRRVTTSGVISFVYLLFSGFLTVLSEYLRATKAEAFGIDLNYFLGAVLLLVGVLGLFYHARHRYAQALRAGLFARLLGRVESQLRFKLKRKQSDETPTDRVSEED